jgi:hypothetical protein
VSTTFPLCWRAKGILILLGNLGQAVRQSLLEHDWHWLCLVYLEKPKKGVALNGLEIIAFAGLFFAIFSTILRKVRQAICSKMKGNWQCN